MIYSEIQHWWAACHLGPVPLATFCACLASRVEGHSLRSFLGLSFFETSSVELKACEAQNSPCYKCSCIPAGLFLFVPFFFFFLNLSLDREHVIIVPNILVLQFIQLLLHNFSHVQYSRIFQCSLENLSCFSEVLSPFLQDLKGQQSILLEAYWGNKVC